MAHTWHRPIDVAVMEAAELSDDDLAQALPQLEAAYEAQGAGYLMTAHRLQKLAQRLEE